MTARNSKPKRPTGRHGQASKKRQAPKPTYTLMHEVMSSKTEPLPAEKRRHQLSRMYEGLASIELGAQPTPSDWIMCADAVNLLETLVNHSGLAPYELDLPDKDPRQGWWLDCNGDPVQVLDSSGLLPEASQVMGDTAERAMAGGNIRLSGRGIFVIRSVLEDYSALLDALPARTMVRAHRLTEKRMREILFENRRPAGTKVIEL